MNGRALLCIAHEIAAQRHAKLMAEIADADELLEEQIENGPQLEDVAHTLFDEALELLRGPRPNYGEALSALDLAASRDVRFVNHWNALDTHYEDAINEAMAKLHELAAQEDAEEIAAGVTH